MIRGVVATDAGTPVHGWVTVKKAGEGMFTTSDTTVQTSPEGEFEIKGLPAGFVDLMATADNYVPYTQQGISVGTVDLKIVLHGLHIR
jgi:hypothetical protein